MALIEKSKGRTSGGGYERLFGNAALGALLSRVHATVISSGNELEGLIASLAQVVTDFDQFLETQPLGTYLVTKGIIKKSAYRSNMEPDLLVFELTATRQHCYIIELKDGDTFDTKKAAGEIKLLKDFQNNISSQLRCTTSIHICSFNQPDKNEIVKGFKKKITLKEAMTGVELCTILGLDYSAIVGSRIHQQVQNMDYFIEKLLSIPEIKAEILKNFK